MLVKIYHGDECREEAICLRQSVKQFKQKLEEYYHITPPHMRLWYYDQAMTKIAGPEEMKFANKELFTYNVIDGDYFVVEEKCQLKCLAGSQKATRRPNTNQRSCPSTPHSFFESTNTY